MWIYQYYIGSISYSLIYLKQKRKLHKENEEVNGKEIIIYQNLWDAVWIDG